MATFLVILSYWRVFKNLKHIEILSEKERESKMEKEKEMEKIRKYWGWIKNTAKENSRGTRAVKKLIVVITEQLFANIYLKIIRYGWNIMDNLNIFAIYFKW